MPTPGFAVIDFETTGLFPGGHDRVIEVAVVHVATDGTVTGSWDTLVNPGRDLGRQDIHRIAAAEILDAPTFEQIAGRLVELLDGRVVVAHNASFDTRFLIAELQRAGYSPDLNLVALCTMRLAREFLPGSGRSLADCCDAFDIQIGDAHRAAADALATAKLLGCYLAVSPTWDGWDLHLTSAEDEAWPPLYSAQREWMPRSATTASPKPHFLERITIKLPEYSGPAEHNDYLALLDRCLLDRHISEHESRGLVQLAEELGISRATVQALHVEYFNAVLGVAWADGVLTGDEQSDLAEVAALLGLPAEVVDAAVAMPPSVPVTEASVVSAFELNPGDLVVLTGEMTRPRDDWHRELDVHGFVAWQAVTKKVKLVAAADPDSLSGKARKARDYGILVVAESWLLERYPKCH